MLPLQSTADQVSGIVAELGGLAILAATLAGVSAFAFRWYVREEVPRGLSLLVALAGVAVYLNTTTALGSVITGSADPTETEVALFNIAAFLVAAGGATVGHWVGDRFGTDVFLGGGLDAVEQDVGRLVTSVGRVIAVELPEDIDDVVGYDPVPAETKETLSGTTFLFPRRLTVEELQDRLVSRLRTDYGVGHVDVELADDGTVAYLALGSRAAGIGPTLPPATNAVAIRADPAFAASTGDLVQVWETDPMRRVLTAELRGVAGDTVTVAIDAADTQKLDPTERYRLVTLPVEDRPDREFASLLRGADETFSSVTVEAGSPLHGLPVGALDLSVVAVKPDSAPRTVLPDPSHVLAAGDTVFAIARPEALRRLEEAAEPLDPSLVASPAAPEPDEQSTAGTDRTTPESVDAQGRQPATDPLGAQPSTDAEKARPPTDSEETQPSAADPDDAPSPASADATGDTAADDSATDDEPVTPSDGDDTVAGPAHASSFQQLKEEFESGEADWADGADGNGSDDGQPPTGATPAADDDTPDSGDGPDPADGGPGTEGPTDEGDDSSRPDDGLAFDDSSEDDPETDIGDEGGALDGLALDDDPDDALQDDSGDEGDPLGGLDFEDESDDDLDTGLDFEDESDDDLDTGLDDGDGLGGLSIDDEDDDLDTGFDESDDDLGSLSFEDDDAGLSFEDDTGTSDGESDDGDEDESDEDDEDDGDDDGDGGDGGGGASSFQQLKEEFESGEADWEDDISDSPGGDMRLDE